MYKRQDLILHVIGVIGVNGGTGHVIEYRGSTIRALSMDERMTAVSYTHLTLPTNTTSTGRPASGAPASQPM